jgi:hypothetical protein
VPTRFLGGGVTWGPFPRTPVSATGPDRPPGLWSFCARSCSEGPKDLRGQRLRYQPVHAGTPNGIGLRVD